MPPYSVIPYRIETLKNLLVGKSRSTIAEVEGKIHKKYFEDYFGKLCAKTIVVEDGYIDRDYLEDFTSYYVKCFQDYDRKCTRLHFFNIDFSSGDFESVLKGVQHPLASKLKKSYLGFIIVKPLPKTIIGRTCLGTYPEENRRKYPVTREYKVSLFGISLSVNTLAYQEQDRVAAACATSTLWSIFQRTGNLFHHPIPTPIEITKSATFNYPTQLRTIPNSGLTLEQMADAIRKVGLEPFPVNVNNEYNLKSTVYSYVKAGVPVAMAVKIVDASVTPHRFMGYHAIAVTGYSLGRSNPTPVGSSDFLSTSSRIDKVYVHDDQIGPFARMESDGVPVCLEKGNPEFSLSTSWRGNSGIIGSARAVPVAILVPLYHKMRITYDVIERIVINFDSSVETFRSNGLIPQLGKRLEWDLFLSTINDLKEEILQSRDLDEAERIEVLTERMPRFVWRATAVIDKKPIVELIFDATDIEQGNFLIRAIRFDRPFFEILKSISNMPSIATIINNSFVSPIFGWIREH